MAGTGSGIPRHRLFFLGFKHKEPAESTATAGGAKQQQGAKRSWRALWPWGRGKGSGDSGSQRGSPAPSSTKSANKSSAHGGSTAGNSARLQGQASLPASTSSSLGGYDEAAAPSPWMESYYGSLGSGPQPSPHLTLRQQYSPGGTPMAAEAAAVAGVQTAGQQAVARKPTSCWLSVTAETGSVDSEGGEGAEAAEGADVAAERARVEALWEQW